MKIDILEVKADILEENDRRGGEVREKLRTQRTFYVNLMGGPGAGKTTLLLQTIKALKDRYRIGVIEADVDAVVDAETIAQTGVSVLQVHTGGSCHMDAGMSARALEKLGSDDFDLVFLENIGNLVCPAEFDVGQALRVMLLSTPEGDDKPLKYPLMFQVSDVLLVNKSDVAEIFGFDLEALRERVEDLHPGMPVIPVSAAKGTGMEHWTAWLADKIEDWRRGLDADH